MPATLEVITPREHFGTEQACDGADDLRSYLAACIDERLREAVAAYVAPETNWEPPPVVLERKWVGRDKRRRRERNQAAAARRIAARERLRAESRAAGHLPAGPVTEEEWQRWEARLQAEGLGDLDERMPDGTWRTAKRGSGAIHPDNRRPAEEMLRRRRAREAYIDWARGVLHTYRFASGLEKRVWALHCDGVGFHSMAQNTPGASYRLVRDIVLRVQRRAGGYAPVRSEDERRAEVRALVWRSDLEVLRALQWLLANDVDIESARRVPELAELLRGIE